MPRFGRTQAHEPTTGGGLTTARDVARAVTFLFVPGDRPERYTKATAAEADIVVIDLEDSVAPGAKDVARAYAAEWFAAGNPGIARINPPGTHWHEADIEALAAFVEVLVLPKADSAETVARVASRLRPGGALVALVETAAGVLAAARVAAVPGVCRLAFGNFDLAAQLGIAPHDHMVLAPMRIAVVLASAAAGLSPPIDGVSGNVKDPDAVLDDSAHAVRLGFGGKLCIHPRQVNAVRDAFVPNERDVAWARRVVQAMEGTARGAVTLHGEMIDVPVIDRARRILDKSRPKT